EADGRERDLVRAAAGAAIAYPRCDRAGRRIFYSHSDTTNTGSGFRPFDLWLVSLDGGEPRRLTTDGACNTGTFTPDGRSVVFSAVRHDRRPGSTPAPTPSPTSPDPAAPKP